VVPSEGEFWNQSTVSLAIEPELALPFEEDSAVRRIHGEGILLLGGGRALLMQIAEPRIALGVAEHSSFQRGRLARLLRTLRPMFAIAFGSREQALAAAAGVNRLHRTVLGNGYSARDADLLVWVLATLIDTTLVMHDLLLPPLEEDAADDYYDQLQIVGRLLGIPPGAMPNSLAALHLYVHDRVQTLEISPVARALAQEIFDPWSLAAPLIWPLRQLTAGLLPPRLRESFGFSWGPGRDRVLGATADALRTVLPVLPASLRRTPRFLMPK
jgi:uncharacterized protein (DUF2236 family)